ncbi:hypothetical protein C4546_02175 [Candidatus Parcubacteria bacterium]|jgi:ABC-type bacteriocin/lantibiotic exporter with double-glycine peptidase domain|nr:MAG: hypothetical protein C4546_02175 [Candidatus Parcubacteria bacterium]
MYLKLPYFKQINGYACGPAVLQMLLRHYGIAKSQKTLFRQAKTNSKVGTSTTNMVKVLKAYGLKTREFNSANFDILTREIKKSQPILVKYLEPGENEVHYAIVLGLKRENLILNDPWHGRAYAFPKKAFRLRWRNLKHPKRLSGWFLTVLAKK